jgi:hypothetical protein
MLDLKRPSGGLYLPSCHGEEFTNRKKIKTIGYVVQKIALLPLPKMCGGPPMPLLKISMHLIDSTYVPCKMFRKTPYSPEFKKKSSISTSPSYVPPITLAMLVRLVSLLSRKITRSS